MGKWYLISINITNKDKKLLNENEIPIGLNWNTNDDLKNTISSDSSFRDYVEKICFNVNDYSSAKLSYFAFEYTYFALNYKDENAYSDTYEEKSFMTQDLFKLRESDDLVVEYLLRIFKMMYKSFLKEEYEEEIMFSDESIILDIYEKIQEKYPKRFVKESVVNYVRMQLSKTYELNEDNIGVCISRIEKILIDKT